MLRGTECVILGILVVIIVERKVCDMLEKKENGEAAFDT